MNGPKSLLITHSGHLVSTHCVPGPVSWVGPVVGKPDSPRWARWKQAHGPGPMPPACRWRWRRCTPSWAGLWLRLHAGLRKPQPFPCPSAPHPRNVLELIEFFEEEDRFYLVFEKMRGGMWGLAQFLSGFQWAWGLRATREKLPGGLPIRGTLGMQGGGPSSG